MKNKQDLEFLVFLSYLNVGGVRGVDTPKKMLEHKFQVNTYDLWKLDINQMNSLARRPCQKTTFFLLFNEREREWERVKNFSYGSSSLVERH